MDICYQQFRMAKYWRNYFFEIICNHYFSDDYIFEPSLFQRLWIKRSSNSYKSNNPTLQTAILQVLYLERLYFPISIHVWSFPFMNQFLHYAPSCPPKMTHVSRLDSSSSSEKVMMILKKSLLHYTKHTLNIKLPMLVPRR